MSKATGQPYQTIPEVADMFGCSERQVWRWIERNELAATKLGRLTRIARVDVEAFVRTAKQASRRDRPRQSKARKPL